MAGTFELFTDEDARIRFRLLAPDGTVLALSQAFEDKAAAAAAINDVRECAGTGLIQDHCLENLTQAALPRPEQPRWRPDACLAKPARRAGPAPAPQAGAKTMSGAPGLPPLSSGPGSGREILKGWMIG
ncbi:YegP family protein [Arthrobacter sp. 92]|uniref:YegP family protein n=1 Tax=Arthrobacter sp. 92 TaxID=3418175 RepID=UPI003D020882